MSLENINKVNRLIAKKYELIKQMVYSAFDKSINFDLLEAQVKEIDLKINQLLKLTFE